MVDGQSDTQEPGKALTLPPEVWAIVLNHLRRPTPPPTGKNERSSIRQPDLAVTMRVNQILNNLAGPLLYKFIITDDFLSLTHGLDRAPAARNIPSKRSLVLGAQRLCLEYSSKGEPTYSAILENGGATFYLVGGGAKPPMMALVVKAENDWLCEAWRRYTVALAGVPLSRPPAISTGAYLGGQDSLYWDANHLEPPVPGLVLAQMQARGDLTQHAARVPTCQRVAYGPLAFATFAVFNGEGPINAVHLDHRLGSVAICMGGTSYWYLPFDGDLSSDAAASDQGTVQSVGSLCESIATAAVNRADKLLQLAAMISKGPTPDLQTNTTLYLTGSLSTPMVLEGLAKHVGPEIRKLYKILGLPPTRHSEDIWHFRKMEEAPPCPACHWSHDTHLSNKEAIVPEDEEETFPLYVLREAFVRVIKHYRDKFGKINPYLLFHGVKPVRW